MKRFMRLLSRFLFALAFIAVAFLLLADIWGRFQPTARHQHAEALALIFVGLAFVCMQVSAESRWKEKLKGILLGMAFALWGSEQYLAPGGLVTAVDGLVVTIFVVDLGLVICATPRRNT
jgi:hypothetical protein